MGELFRGVPKPRKSLWRIAVDYPSFVLGKVPFVGGFLSAPFQWGEIRRSEERGAASSHFLKVLALRGPAVGRPEAREPLSQRLSLANGAERKAVLLHLARVSRFETARRAPFSTSGLSREGFLARRHALERVSRRVA